MGIISTEVEVGLSGNNINYYENLGYEIPRRKDKQYKIRVQRGSKITVNIKDLPKYSNVKLDVECDNCGKPSVMSYNTYCRYNHEEKIYCHKCAIRLFNSGEKSHFYKPELTSEEREKGRLYKEYHDFIKKVLARDDYTCQCCGKYKTEVDILVHHLDGYNWCKEKRTDVTNGITLCRTCHEKFHSIYGKGYNTKEQFEKWIGNVLQELKDFDGEILSTRRIYCYEEDKIYDSVDEYARINKVNRSSIYKACNNNLKTVYKKHYFWLDEYQKMTQEEIEIRLSSDKFYLKSVICITTDVMYETLLNASSNTGIRESCIMNCCRHRTKYTRTEDGEKLQWMFYDEYLKTQNQLLSE